MTSAFPQDREDPGLVAVALVIRSRDGPRFVFSYPPRPARRSSARSYQYGTELDESEVKVSKDEEHTSEDSDLEEDFHKLHKKLGKLDLNDSESSHVDMLSDEHHDGPNGVPWEHFGEFSTVDLESILTPSRAFHKKKFELSLDPLCFLSYPLHVREDGLWKRPRKSQKKKAKTDGETEQITSTNSEDGESGGITMFNAVFVMSLSKMEANQRIYNIYEHVVKNFNKALNHAQSQDNYVWKESEMILAMKEKAREERRPLSWLWSQVLVKSTLATAIRDTYIAISRNEIANLRFGNDVDISLQIPIPTFLTRPPRSTEKSMPGLLVTSANPFQDEEGNVDDEELNQHFALLLLDDEDKIVAGLTKEDSQLSAAILHCVEIAKPTISFLQASQLHKTDLGSILTLARHLILWRKAIAIPPLHGRNTYIVSPNCDSHKLPVASIEWTKAFPFAPTLPNFLSRLSMGPRAYKTLAPSKSHRPTYMEMLIWLMRRGWVTQLRTFAWILVFPEIVYEVDYQLKKEKIEKAKKVASGEKLKSPGFSDESSPDKSHFSITDAPLTNEQIAENARVKRVSANAANEAKLEEEEFASLPLPVATKHPSLTKYSTNPQHMGLGPIIIVDPHRASHVETLYIAAYGERFTDPKIKEHWGKFYKYFNGKEALEDIAVKEGLKRKETWGFLMQFQEFLLVTTHW